MGGIQEPWEEWEILVQERLGLRSTVGSGNQFYDPSDGIDKLDHTETDFRVMVDSKCTESSSYRVQIRLLNQWVRKARELGYRFALPVRLLNGGEPDDDQITDFVTITFEDYIELVESYREREVEKRAKPKPPPKKVIFTEEDMSFLTKIGSAIKNLEVRTKFLTIIEKGNK